MARITAGIVEAVTLVGAAFVSIVMMLRSASWSIDVGALPFLIWVVSPYVIFWLAGRLFRKFISAPHIPVIAAVIAVLMLAFTIFAYGESYNTGSSTEALVYVIAPIYLYAGSLFLLSLGTAIDWLIGRRNMA